MNSTMNILCEKYSAKSFFKFNFRQNIQHLILYLIIAVLVLILPTVMMIEDYYDNATFSSNYRSPARVIDCVQMIGVLGVFVSGGIAVLSGMSSLAHVNSKQNIGCYHSFPIRRETMYFIDSLTRTLYYGITMLFGYFVPYIMLFIMLPSDLVLRYSGDFFKLLFVGILAFMLIYFVFLFAAGLTGTAFMRFLMVGAIFFLPVAVYAIIVVMFVMADDDLSDLYYISEETLQYICTPFRAYIGTLNLMKDGKFMTLLLIIPEALTYYIGGLFLHKYRRTEATGTTIIWKPVFNVLKYTIIVSCTLFGAWMFKQIEDSSLSFFIGAVIGAVLSLILTNTLLYRSSKVMFSGMKSFAVCCAAVFVFVLFVPLNVTGKIGDFYSALNTKELVIDINRYGYKSQMKFDDTAEIEKILALLDSYDNLISGDRIPTLPVLDPREDHDYELLDSDYLTTAYMYYDDMSEEQLREYVNNRTQYEVTECYFITVTQKPKFGIPLYKKVCADTNSIFSAELVRTEQYAEMMDITSWLDLEEIDSLNFEIDSRILECYEPDENDKTTGYYQNCSSTYVEDIDGMWEKALAVLSFTRFDVNIHESSPVIGNIRIYYNNSQHYTNYPIYAEDLRVLNGVSELFCMMENSIDKSSVEWKPYESAEEYYLDAPSHMNDTNSLILLVDCETGETKKLTAEEFAQLGKYTASYITDDIYQLSYLIRKSESKYAVIYQLDDRYDMIVRFRKDAITDTELAKYFEN